MRVFLVCVVALALAGGANAQSRPATKDFPKDKGKDKKDGKDDKYEAPEKTGADTVGGKTLKEWMKDLSSGDPSRRVTAVLAIVNFGDEAADAVPLLIERLADTDVSPRAKACVALRYVTVHEKHVKDVVKALGHRLSTVRESQAVVRYEAAVSLARFAEDCAPIIPALISGMTDGSSWEIRHACASVLWRAARDPKNGPDERAVKAMIDRLKASRFPAAHQEKLELIIGLGSMGRPKSTQQLNDVIAVFQSYAYSPPTVSRSLALWAYAGLVSMLDDPKKGEAALAGIAKFLSERNKPEIRVRRAPRCRPTPRAPKSTSPNCSRCSTTRSRSSCRPRPAPWRGSAR